MRDWTAYLDSVCEEYAQWWDNFTVTDVERSLLDLEVERIEEARSPSEREKKERLGVLTGLRKYAKERVLLIGVPGSGKSTALRRLVLEVAQEVKEGKSDRIPVLIELRYATKSIFQRIVKEIKKRDRKLKIDERVLEEELLYEEKFLLLFDGLNELPSDAIKAQLQQLEADYPNIWMVFTTRNLGNAGIVNVEKQLTMQPLTEEQMKIFVRKQQQGEQILQQLGSRLRELGKTPMFLWMLCKTVRVAGDVPRNAGELLHRFVLHEYERGLKKEISAGDLRECWQDLLEELAFAMMPRKDRLDIRLVVSRKEAEEILEKFLAEKGESDLFRGVKKYLKGLLAHHLLQVGGEDRLEFHHQLIQEYYAAMRLKRMVSGLTDEVLQRDYLNLFEWTEAIALMLGLLEDEEQAVRVVRSALAVDWQLGARLAGEVKREFQGKTVALVSELDVPLKVKVELWGMTRSDESVRNLIFTLQDSDSGVRCGVVKALGNIDSKQALETLINVLQGEDYLASRRAAGILKTEQAVNSLIAALKNKDPLVRMRAIETLGKIGSEQAIMSLMNILQDKNSKMRRRAARALGKIDSKRTIKFLRVNLQSQDSNVRRTTVETLGNIGVEQAIEPLITVLNDLDPEVRKSTIKALDNIRSEQAIEPLIAALYDQNSKVRECAAAALGHIGSEQAIEPLIIALHDQDSKVREYSIIALRNIGTQQAVQPLILALQDENPFARGNAVGAIEYLNSEQRIEISTSLLQDEHHFVRASVASQLGKISSEWGVKFLEFLIIALQDKHPFVRRKVAEALGNIGIDKVVYPLILALQDDNFLVRRRAAEALGKVNSDRVIVPLIKILQDDDFLVRKRAAEALGKVACSTFIFKLFKIFPRAFALMPSFGSLVPQTYDGEKAGKALFLRSTLAAAT
ncbi:HEAT repeat domain-containing protein [Spirulina sp. 06S082]|uniref:HEAT repeat domain-containing protein n=1 Tax=Spirulina sp. 06S082 TaxID=3110248 RepID=UPI002B208A43|nr:HEAT repeat domain-containing protein [Spirulina sp. 06S082]MEA5468343.1 HEAT repeat domain-containing protein [Spirulina sp. 06S082]